MKRLSAPSIVALLALATIFSACKDATLDAELYGGIEGVVYDFETKVPLSGASITTSPPTSALVTDEAGAFALPDVLEGNYTITATRPGFAMNSVTISVRENQTTQANIFLTAKDEAANKASLAAEVLGWSSTSRNDSTFVQVEYRVRNTGAVAIPAYEIYFRIPTPARTYFQEQTGTGLKIGQADIGSFRKYIDNQQAQDVVIEDFWFQGQDTTATAGTTATPGAG